MNDRAETIAREMQHEALGASATAREPASFPENTGRRSREQSTVAPCTTASSRATPRRSGDDWVREFTDDWAVRSGTDEAGSGSMESRISSQRLVDRVKRCPVERTVRHLGLDPRCGDRGSNGWTLIAAAGNGRAHHPCRRGPRGPFLWRRSHWRARQRSRLRLPEAPAPRRRSTGRAHRPRARLRGRGSCGEQHL